MKQSVKFLVVLGGWLLVAATGWSLPYVLGDTTDVLVARAAGLAGGFVTSAGEIPADSDVILLGAALTRSWEPSWSILLDQGCRIIRLGSADRQETRETVAAFQRYLGAGNQPFAQIPTTMGTVNSETVFPVLQKLDRLKDADRQLRDPLFTAKPLFNPPPEPDPPPGFEGLDTLGRIILAISFAPNSSQVTPRSIPVLQRLFTLLAGRADLRLTIEGHTDTFQDTGHNLRLSQERASAVRDWLVTRGIDGSRLEAIGYGETRPIADNGTSAGRARNRRVEISKR